MSTAVAPKTLAVPTSHLDLLTPPICGVLFCCGTRLSRGSPGSIKRDWIGRNRRTAPYSTTARSCCRPRQTATASPSRGGF